MTMTISDLGVTFNSGNVVDLHATMPTLGSYVAGDIVLEVTTSPRVSGWKRQTTGSTHILGTDWIYFSSGIVSDIPKAATSGTFIDFTGIQPWVRRATLMLKDVSTSGTSNIIAQLGTVSAFETTGYNGGSWQANTTITAYSTGFILGNSTAAATSVSETLVLNLVDPATFSYVGFGTGAVNSAGGGNAHIQAGNKSLASQLTRIRVTTVGGTDTFDAGQINVMYE